MSKNFELLRRVGNEEVFDLPQPSVQTAPRPPNGNFYARQPANAEIAKLVQRLFLRRADHRIPAAVSFSGIAPGERTSWICARTAETLVVQTDASVCVVDADVRSPQLHVHYRASNHTGLVDALSTRGAIRNFAIRLGSDNLWVVPAGISMPGFVVPMERLRERVAELQEEFEHVLVCAPALARETEAISIAQLTSGIVLIVEANSTRRETVRRAKEQLETAGVKLLGAVLDQRQFPIPEKIYRRL